MSITFTENLNKKMSDLSIKKSILIRLLNVRKHNVYKWFEGTQPYNSVDKRKLERFVSGEFDRFIINGKLSAKYDYDDAQAILFPRNPTNDFHGTNPYEQPPIITMAAEEQAPYGNNINALNKIIVMQDKEISKLKLELKQFL